MDIIIAFLAATLTLTVILLILMLPFDIHYYRKCMDAYIAKHDGPTLEAIYNWLGSEERSIAMLPGGAIYLWLSKARHWTKRGEVVA